MTVERFFDDAEERLKCTNGERRQRLEERLTLARVIMGGVDPLDFIESWVAPGDYAAMALMKRSPKMTANWALAMDHSRGGIFHSFSDRFKIR